MNPEQIKYIIPGQDKFFETRPPGLEDVAFLGHFMPRGLLLSLNPLSKFRYVLVLFLHLGDL